MPDRYYLRKPDWLKIRIPSGNEYKGVYQLMKKYNLSTVCQEARCPNINECWNRKSATIMILGKVCTRACRFCAVATGNPKGDIDPDEPDHAAEVIQILDLHYVVITSVDRDDLPDYGSSHYAETIKSVKKKNPRIKIEALIPDFGADPEHIKRVINAQPLVIGHNVETVKRLTPFIRDRRCSYEKSLAVLQTIKELDCRVHTKSGFMVGLGESNEEIEQTLRDLHAAGVDIVTIGQYLQPTKKNALVRRYYTPEEFENFKKIATTVGIRHVISGPLVRSSYRASEVLQGKD
jgi:lipoic acid synthetase